MSKPFRSITEIRQAHEARGGHFFAPDTMRWWHSRVHETVYPSPWGAYFVTSDNPTGASGSRSYTVRHASSAGSDRGMVETRRTGFASRSGAHAYARREAANDNRLHAKYGIGA